MILNQFMRKLGYISEKNLVTVAFEVYDDFEPDSITENKYGWRTVSLNCKLKPTFIGECRGDCRIELGKESE